jgi:myosin heavy subunit
MPSRQEFLRQRKIEQERQQELIRQQREIEKKKRETVVMASKVAMEATALTARKKQAMDAEQRLKEEQHQEHLKKQQEELARTQKELEEQEAKLEVERKEQQRRLDKQKAEQEKQKAELEQQQGEKQKKLEEVQRQLQVEMEKKLHVELHQKLKVQQDKLQREQDEVQREMKQHQEKMMMDQRSKPDISSSYVVNAVDKIESKTVCSSRRPGAAPSRRPSLTNRKDAASRRGSVASRKESIASRRDSIASRKDSIPSRRDSIASRKESIASRRGSIASLKKAATPIAAGTATTTAIKLPPRPYDYDDYYYQDEDGNWRNEYDDEGYEFDPDEYEDNEDGENGEWDEEEEVFQTKPQQQQPSPPSGVQQDSGRKSSLAVPDMNGATTAGSINNCTAVAASVAATPESRRTSNVSGDVKMSSSNDISRRESVHSQQKRNSVTPCPSVLPTPGPTVAPTPHSATPGSILSAMDEPMEEEEELVKLPPRPVDYDYFWYEDEDGNWRNEYDDQGYEFDPDVYEETKEEDFYTEEEIKGAEEQMKRAVAATPPQQPVIEQESHQFLTLMVNRITELV